MTDTVKALNRTRSVMLKRTGIVITGQLDLSFVETARLTMGNGLDITFSTSLPSIV